MKLFIQFKPAYLLAMFILSVGTMVIFSCTKEAKNSSTLQALSASASSSADLSLPPEIDTAGLVAWYDFNQGSLRDRSSYHNNIKFNNAQLTTDRKGVANNAYYFDGHSYMRVRNSPSLNPDKAITMFAVVQVADFYEGLCHGNRILNKSYEDIDPGDYYFDFNDGRYTKGMNCSQDVDKMHENFVATYGNAGSGRSNAGFDTTGYVEPNHWYHLIFTYAKGVSHFYIDGKLVYTNIKIANFTPNSQDLFIGMENKFNTKFPYWFTGAIDQIGIFNVALNADQVAKLSNY